MPGSDGGRAAAQTAKIPGDREAFRPTGARDTVRREVTALAREAIDVLRAAGREDLADAIAELTRRASDR